MFVIIKFKLFFSHQFQLKSMNQPRCNCDPGQKCTRDGCVSTFPPIFCTNQTKSADRECEEIVPCKNHTDCSPYSLCWQNICIPRIKCPCEAPYTCDYETGFCSNIFPPKGCDYPYTNVGGVCGFKSCSSKIQCIDGREICPDGYCKPICISNRDCRAGQRCVGRECIRICTGVATCQKGSYCDSEMLCRKPECYYDSECKSDKYCRYGKCIPKICWADSDCDKGFKCLREWNICIKKPDGCIRCEESNQECIMRWVGSTIYYTCEIGIICVSQRECPINMHCGRNGICVVPDCYKGCLQGYGCYNGECLPRPPSPPSPPWGQSTTEAVEPTDTTEPTRRTSKPIRTTPSSRTTSLGPPSPTDTPLPPPDCDPRLCGPGQVCKFGRCVIPGCRSYQECPDPTDCWFGECRQPCDPDRCPGKCVNNVCTICVSENGCEPPKPPSCYEDFDCPPPYVCRNRLCVQIICKQTTECPPWQECKDGFCIHILERNKTICTSNADCEKNQVCGKKGCVPPCTTAIECATGVACIDELCRVERCRYDYDCGPGMHCSDGECIYVKRCTRSGNNMYQCIHGRLMKEKFCNGFFCEEGYECFLGKICLPKDIKCRDYTHCSEMSKCGSYGKCVLLECIIDSDCSINTRECVQGLCVPKLSCILHSDCEYPYKCIGRVCLPEKLPPSCIIDTDCPSNLGKCLDGKCKEPDCEKIEDCCQSSAEFCIFECKYGKCVTTYIGCQPWHCPSGKCNKYNTTCLLEPPDTDKCDCKYGYICDKNQCIPPSCRDRCPQKGTMCVFGQCVKIPFTKPPCFCSNGQDCTKNPCPPKPEPPPPSCYDNLSCVPPFHCDLMTRTCTGGCNNDTDCQQIVDDTVKYICKDKDCKIEAEPPCEDKCPKPGYMCWNKRCIKIECVEIFDCGAYRSCFLGRCIDNFKTYECLPDSVMERNRTLHCLPKEIYTSTTEIEITVPEITCETLTDCPQDMKCKKKKCIPKECDPPVDSDAESNVDQCDDHKMCFTAKVSGKQSGICLPIFPCEMNRCAAPVQPAKGVYKCHKYNKKCFVSTDECETNYDCLLKAEGQGEYMCILNAKTQLKVCIRIDCTKEKTCPEERPNCFKNRCQECRKCKNNQDCSPYEQCVGSGSSKKKDSGCCVEKLTCPPNDCNEVLNKPKGDYCLSGVCTLCYTTEGRKYCIIHHIE